MPTPLEPRDPFDRDLPRVLSDDDATTRLLAESLGDVQPAPVWLRDLALRAWATRDPDAALAELLERSEAVGARRANAEALRFGYGPFELVVRLADQGSSGVDLDLRLIERRAAGVEVAARASVTVESADQVVDEVRLVAGGTAFLDVARPGRLPLRVTP